MISTQSPMQTPSEAALAYCQLGLSVVPIAAGQKMPPMGMQWADRQSTRPGLGRIRNDFATHPGAGVAIITGQISGVVVLDIDPNRASAETLDAMRKLMSSRWAKCPRVKTGGGGWHLYFAAPAVPLSNAVNVNGMSGIDIRANGGLVVAPPTKHQSGQLYRWEVPFTREALQPLPQEFLPQAAEPDAPRPNWIEQALRGVGAGERNDTCARLAGYFLGKGLAPDIVIQVLGDTFAKNCTPPMSALEVDTTVRSVYKREGHQAKMREEAKEKTAAKAGFALTHIDQFMVNNADAITEWTIPEWLPDGAVAFLVAPPGSYKTWLLLDLALSLATGSPFLGQYEVNRPGPVILVQQEDHKAGIASRLAKIWHARFPFKLAHEFGREFELPQQQVPIWVHETRSLRLDSRESIAALGTQVAKIRPRAVLIDPLYSTLSTDDYMAGAAEQMLALKTLRDRYGCSFVFAHHTRKKADEGRLGAWGSQFLNAFIETGWQIRKPDDTSSTVSVVRHHKVSAALPAITLDWCIEENGEYVVTVGGVDAIGDVVQAILTALSAKPHTMAELAEATKVHRSTISRKLAAMEKDKMVVQDGKVWKLTEGG